MEPVRKLVGDSSHLLISPDGPLNLIPFSALVDEQGRYLVETNTLTYLTSGRDLLRLQNGIQSREPTVIIADPNFNSGAKPGQAAGPSLAGTFFEPLRRLVGSAKEAEKLKEAFPNARVKSGDQATEAVIKQISGPEILHIATHGFFLEDEQEKALPGKVAAQMRLVVRRKNNTGGPEAPPGKRLTNPLLRSGLFFAGANANRNEAEDGILTALEASGLDLWGTKLVVLSACDTGVGEVKNGDGVYGLRRALVLAGSESQMMSLWPVSDTGTSELMVEYYKALKAGQGRSEALRQVQLKMLKDPIRQHPFYWASFIQSGEWANLDGKRVD
jgi:CHAT domain-containing protein